MEKWGRNLIFGSGTSLEVDWSHIFTRFGTFQLHFEISYANLPQHLLPKQPFSAKMNGWNCKQRRKTLYLGNSTSPEGPEGMKWKIDENLVMAQNCVSLKWVALYFTTTKLVGLRFALSDHLYILEWLQIWCILKYWTLMSSKSLAVWKKWLLIRGI